LRLRSAALPAAIARDISAGMKDRDMRRIGVILGLSMALLPSCASRSVSSGAAVGKAGQGLSARAQNVPQGAQACEMHEALNAPPPGTPEKAEDDACAKALNSDILWRR
jgi:hypothetical protein